MALSSKQSDSPDAHEVMRLMANDRLSKEGANGRMPMALLSRQSDSPNAEEEMRLLANDRLSKAGTNGRMPMALPLKQSDSLVAEKDAPSFGDMFSLSDEEIAHGLAIIGSGATWEQVYELTCFSKE